MTDIQRQMLRRFGSFARSLQFFTSTRTSMADVVMASTVAQSHLDSLVYPIDKWVLMLLAAGAKVRNLGDVRWLATEDGSTGKGTGRHIACFILEPEDKP